MAKTAGVVSIDGADYDVVSGRVVGAIKKTAKISAMPTASQVIDGFIKRSSKPANHKPKPKISGAKLVASKRVVKTKRPASARPASLMHSRTQHSQALVRRGLARPVSSVKAATRSLTNPATSLHKMVDPTRLARAKAIPRSDKISRFVKDQVIAPNSRKKTYNGELLSSPARASTAKASASATSAMVAASPHQRLERMLDFALARADAHKKATQNNRNWRRLWLRSRWLGVVLVISGALLTALFLAWRNIPAVAIKVADLRSHVSASLPSYTPAGYGYSGPLSYGLGKVTIVYKDKTNTTHAYSLTQQKSNWDSTTLQNSINSSKSQVQSSQAGGLTVYIYNNNGSAAWVNNGLLYSIQNKASLSSDQILNIAQSL